MNPYMKKMSVINELRKFFESKGFQEVCTPILRYDAGNLIRRKRVDGNLALRDSHELTLRYLLAFYSSIFEIGSCFRYEQENSPTNLPEFLLLESFTTCHNLDALQAMCKEILFEFCPATLVETVSIAAYIEKNLKIDLYDEPQEKLYEKLRQLYPDFPFRHEYEYVFHYIEKEIQPLSKGKALFLKDYPECTCSYAKIIRGSVINRFELFANNLELANAFEDEGNPEALLERNRELPLFPNEERAIADALRNGVIPARSYGLGIGIERLCMHIFNSADIRDFAFPSRDF